MSNIGRAHPEYQGHGRSMMPGDSVWLCSTHPKPLWTMFPGLAGTDLTGKGRSG